MKVEGQQFKFLPEKELLTINTFLISNIQIELLILQFQSRNKLI